MATPPWVYAYWWHERDNFGDKLTPYLIEKIGKKQAVWVCPGTPVETNFVCGSVLTHNTTYGIVWGSGLIANEKPNHKPKEIRAVRGMLTYQRFLDAGIECPPVFGDPGLVLPLVYRPRVEKRYKLGLVPHWSDQYQVFENYGSEPDVLVVNICDSVERVIDQINQCERIVSSSLHGLVVADAYGIPSQWAVFNGVVHGRPFKFFDYWSGVGIRSYPALDLKKKMPVQEILARVEYRPIKANIDRLMEACPFRA
jgi:pyruvyltransferase